MEYEWGRLLYESGCVWHDLVSGRSFNDIAALRALADSDPALLIQTNNPVDTTTYRQFARWLPAPDEGRLYAGLRTGLALVIHSLRRPKNYLREGLKSLLIR